METNEQTTTQETPSTGGESSLGHKESKGLSVLSRPESSTSGDATSEHSEQYQSEQAGQQRQDDTQQPEKQSQVDELAQKKEIQDRAAQQGIDPAELAKAIVQAQHEAQRVQQAETKPEYTEDDFKRDFGVFEMDKNTFDSMFGVDAEPEQIEAFNHVIKRTSAMAVKMAQYQAQQMLEQFKQEIQPIQAAYKGFQAKSVDKKFMTKYPQLAKHTNLVKSVVSQLKSEGRNFKSVDEAMDEAASRAKAMLQEAGVNLSQPQPKQRNQAQPATASVGPGGAGTRQSTSSARPKSHGLNVLKKAMN